MPGGTYLSSFLEAETDGTLRGGQLQPVIDYAAATTTGSAGTGSVPLLP